MQLVAQFVKVPAQAARFCLRPFQQGHGRAHGRFWAEARQARHLFDEFLERFGNALHTDLLLTSQGWILCPLSRAG